MEAFIRDVCTLAASRGARNVVSDKVPSTKAVLQVLKQWAEELSELERLQELVAVLSEALTKRALPGLATSATTVLSPRDMLDAVRDLVHQERKALRAIDTFERADLHLQLQPDDLLSKLCNHFGFYCYFKKNRYWSDETS